MIEVDESEDVLGIFGVIGGEGKPVDVNERKITDDEKQLSRSQSVRRCEQEGC